MALIYFAIFIVLTSTVVYFASPDLIALNYYLFAILFIANVHFFKRIVSLARKSTRINFWYLIASMLIFITAFCLGYVNINRYSIWFNEYEEFRNFTSFSDVLSQAAVFQQPPLGYLIRWVFVSLLGYNEFALRIPSLMFWSLAAVALFNIFYSECRSIVLSYTSALFIALNPIFISYSVEAASYSISLFFATMFLMSFLKAIKNTGRPIKLNYELIIWSLLWMLTLSMQPLFFVSITVVACLIHTKANKNFAGVALSLIVAMLAFIPFCDFIISKSKKYFRTSTDWIEIFYKFIENDLYSLKLIFVPKTSYFYFEVLLLLVGAVLISTDNNRKSKLIQLFYLILQILILITSFEFFIQWHMNPRYLIISLLSFKIFFVMLVLAKQNILIGSKRKTILLSIICGWATYLASTNPMLKYHNYSWRELTYKLDQETRNQSDAFLFAFEKPGVFSHENFIGQLIYSPTKVKLHYTNFYEFPLGQANDKIYKLLSENRNHQGDFQFIIPSSDLPRDIFDKIVLKNAEKEIFLSYYIVKYSNQGLMRAVKEFYLELERINVSESSSLKAHDGLFLVSLLEKNCLAAQKYFFKMKEIFDANKDFENYGLRILRNTRRFFALCKN